MANIADKIAQIRQAIFGKDVRENIASGIEVINSEVESTTQRQTNLENTFNAEISNSVSTNPSSAETVAGRTDNVNNITYETLGKRLDAHSSSLNDMKKSVNRLQYKTVSATVTDTFIPDDNIFKHLQTEGADTVLVAMVNITSATDPNPVTMDDSRILQSISNANARNVKVKMLKPHLGINWSDGFSRYGYIPSNYPLFFSNWKTIMLHYAQLCVNNNIPILCISCEQYDNTKSIYSSYWQDIYNSIKSSYPNLIITIALSTPEWAREDLEICKYVDFIGANIYLKYTHKEYNNGNITQSDVNKAFYSSLGLDTIKTLLNIYSKYRKPIFITEIGCMPKTDGLIQVIATGSTNYDVQALLFKGALDVLCNLQIVVGISFWHVANPFCYYLETEITKAEQVLIDYFKGGKV